MHFREVFLTCFLPSIVDAQNPKSLGKYKNWETFVYSDGKGKICFAQTIPIERTPKNFKRNSSSSILNQWRIDNFK